jgi:hypothetical protein
VVVVVVRATSPSIRSAPAAMHEGDHSEASEADPTGAVIMLLIKHICFSLPSFFISYFLKPMVKLTWNAANTIPKIFQLKLQSTVFSSPTLLKYTKILFPFCLARLMLPISHFTKPLYSSSFFALVYKKIMLLFPGNILK